MSEQPQPTKEQIQTEYSKTVAMLGDNVFRYFLPIIEIFEQMKRLLNLNQQMHKVLQAEAEEKKKVDAKLGVKE